MSQVIGRLGEAVILLQVGQSVVVGSPGAGNTNIYTSGFVNNQLNPIYKLFAEVNNGAWSYTNNGSNALWVKISACNGGEVEYDYGATPMLTNNATLGVTGLVATGSGQGGAVYLPGNLNIIATVPAAADSFQLPPGQAGQEVTVYNAGANSTTIYPQTGGTINSGAANAGFAVAATKSCIFKCVTPNVWIANLSA